MVWIQATLQVQEGIPYAAPMWLIKLGSWDKVIFMALSPEYWLGLN